jgi:hypothetical protein
MDQEIKDRLALNVKWLSDFLLFRTEWAERFDHFSDDFVSLQNKIAEAEEDKSTDEAVVLDLMKRVFEFVLPILREVKDHSVLY